MRNIKNSIRYPKVLLGKALDESLSKELPYMTAGEFSTSDDQNLVLKVSLRNNTEYMTAEQLSAAFLVDLKKTAEKNIGADLSHVVLTVPPAWSTRQRTALLDASKIAGYNVIGLVNDVSAAAVNWVRLLSQKRTLVSR